jgi:glycerol-3-phosphate acyltransferase PlsX
MLIDAGLNPSCKLINYLQFAEIGTIYMKEMYKINRPKVGLINVGSEENKGTEVVKEAHQRLKELPGINFIGNAESREYVYGACDVGVCDGFTGNVLLKTIEGVGSFIADGIKSIFLRNNITKIAAAVLKKDVSAFFKKLDYEVYGGTPILGIQGSVFKGHGNSSAKSIMCAVESAVEFGNSTIMQQLNSKYGNGDV